MKKLEFKLKDEYITLVNLLKVCDVVASGGEVKILLMNDLITYNDTIAFQKKKKVFSGDVVTVNDEYEIRVI